MRIKVGKYRPAIVAALLMAAAWTACTPDEVIKPPVVNRPVGESTFKTTPYEISYPKGFLWARIKIPDNNPMTVEGVSLGKKLFYDPILSAQNTLSCGSCHKQSYSFTDSLKFSLGENGEVGTRNAMPLFNLAWAEMYNPTPHRFMWDGGHPDLENQVLGPIKNPVEMNQNLAELERELRRHADYPALFKKAFNVDSITIKYVMFALAQFERTLISGTSKFDKFKQGLTDLTEDEYKGMELFSREDKGDCFHCHGNTSSPFFTNFRFHNNGLDAAPADPGLAAVTNDPFDHGKFKVPSLRNLSFTAPYMHDGRFNTLEEVIEFYNSGTKAGPTTDEFIAKHVREGGLHLTNEEKQQLIAFLRTLDDYEFLSNPQFK